MGQWRQDWGGAVAASAMEKAAAKELFVACCCWRLQLFAATLLQRRLIFGSMVVFLLYNIVQAPVGKYNTSCKVRYRIYVR